MCDANCVIALLLCSTPLNCSTTRRKLFYYSRNRYMCIDILEDNVRFTWVVLLCIEV